MPAILDTAAWPYLTVRMPAANDGCDHLVADRYAAEALAGDDREAPAMCGLVILPAPTVAWRRPLCQRCLDLMCDSAKRASLLYSRDVAMAAEAKRAARRRLLRWKR